ncbi:MAG: hypothetical protein JNL32_01935 [Candidatus Kapabacteria bacterium]|nr:hypothetical protein [Candidatus Kapabacteria bacterium]
MSTSQTITELHRKRKRRNIEYLLLISVCGYGSGATSASIVWILALPCCVVFAVSGWILAMRREERRFLPASDMYRATSEVAELIIGIVFVIAMYVVILISSLSSQTYFAGMIVMLLCYLAATYFAEQYWTYRIFIGKPIASQLNYIVNLPESVIKPMSRSSIKTVKQGLQSYFNS